MRLEEHYGRSRRVDRGLDRKSRVLGFEDGWKDETNEVKLHIERRGEIWLCSTAQSRDTDY